MLPFPLPQTVSPNIPLFLFLFLCAPTHFQPNQRPICTDSVLFGTNNAPGASQQPIPGLAATSALLQPIDRKGKQRATHNNADTKSSSDYLALDMNGDGGESGLGGGYQQMQLVEQQVSSCNRCFFILARELPLMNPLSSFSRQFTGLVHPIPIHSYRINRVHHR